MLELILLDANSVKLGSLALVFAATFDLLLPFLLAPFCANYKSTKKVMSALGNKNCPGHTVYNSWLIVAGGLFMAGGMALYTIYAPISTFYAVAIVSLLFVYAIGGCILSGCFAVGETKECLTLKQKMHGFGAVIGFMALLFVPLLIGCLFFQLENRVLGLISFFFWGASLFFFSLFIMADKARFASTFIAQEGLWQRLSLCCMYIPLVMLACHSLNVVL